MHSHGCGSWSRLPDTGEQGEEIPFIHPAAENQTGDDPSKAAGDDGAAPPKGRVIDLITKAPVKA